MTWNPQPEVAAARDFARKFDANRVVILYTQEYGNIGCASYGNTKALCTETKSRADKAYEAFYDTFKDEP